LIHFRGDPDPFKGDVPNARVREFSKEVVEVLFNSTPITNTNKTLAAQVGGCARHTAMPLCGEHLLRSCSSGKGSAGQRVLHCVLFNSTRITNTNNALAAQVGV
jgi:hypothetical protein